MKDIKKLQTKIRQIDRQIVSLLEDRASGSREIGRLKKSGDKISFDASLHKTMMDHILGLAHGALSPEALQKIYAEIVSQCQILEAPLRMGFLGPEGTFTHQASVAEFGSGPVFVPCSSVDDLFTFVEKKQVDCSVVAIENSTGGVVHEVLDRFLDSDVKINSEIITYIHHCLIGRAPIDKVKKIFSHPQPFVQCRRWLRQNLPHARLIEVSSTVEGVRRAKESSGSAAIGSEIAARIHGMKILASNIQDTTENYTRFVVLGRVVSPPTGSDKTSIIISLKHKPGTLFEALQPFARRSVNLTKIESRPTRQHPWEYVFFIDFEGHVNDKRVKSLLKDLEPHTMFIKFLGSYPFERLYK